MPIQTQESKTPKGERLMLNRVSGQVSLADAQQMGSYLTPGRPFHAALVLNLVDRNTEYSPDSRKYFPTLNGNYKRMASVVASPIVAAGINFMLRLGSRPDNFRMFNSESAALDWLDQGTS